MASNIEELLQAMERVYPNDAGALNSTAGGWSSVYALCVGNVFFVYCVLDRILLLGLIDVGVLCTSTLDTTISTEQYTHTRSLHLALQPSCTR